MSVYKKNTTCDTFQPTTIVFSKIMFSHLRNKLTSMEDVLLFSVPSLFICVRMTQSS